MTHEISDTRLLNTFNLRGKEHGRTKLFDGQQRFMNVYFTVCDLSATTVHWTPPFCIVQHSVELFGSVTRLERCLELEFDDDEA